MTSDREILVIGGGIGGLAAAHPMLQYLAQGGCQAIEDAAALAAALARHDHGRAAAPG